MEKRNFDQPLEKRAVNSKGRKRKKLISVPNKKRTNKTNEQPKPKRKKVTANKKYVSKKRVVRRRKIIAITSVALILISAVVILSITVFFPIKSIKIVDNKRYTTEEISTSIGVVKGDNLLLSNEQRATKALKEKYPYIKSLDFQKKLPFTLVVKVNEYKVFAQVKQGDSFLRVGNDGTVLEQTKKYYKNAPVITGVKVTDKSVGKTIEFENKDDKQIFEEISAITTAFNENQIGKITLINFKNMQDVKVTYNNRIVLLLGSTANLEKKLIHAKEIIDIKGDTNETGTLNLSGIPSDKNVANFYPRELKADEIAGK